MNEDIQLTSAFDVMESYQVDRRLDHELQAICIITKCFEWHLKTPESQQHVIDYIKSRYPERAFPPPDT